MQSPPYADARSKYLHPRVRVAGIDKFPRRNVEPVGETGDLVRHRDVDVTLCILKHLGRFYKFNGRCLEDRPCVDRTQNLRGALETVGIDAAHHKGHRAELIIGSSLGNAFGRVGEVKIHSCLQAARFLERRHHQPARGSDRHGGSTDDHGPPLRRPPSDKQADLSMLMSRFQSSSMGMPTVMM